MDINEFNSQAQSFDFALAKEMVTMIKGKMVVINEQEEFEKLIKGIDDLPEPYPDEVMKQHRVKVKSYHY